MDTDDVRTDARLLRDSTRDANAFGVFASNGSGPAYALTRAPNGIIRVNVYPNFDEVKGLQAALADAGLDAVDADTLTVFVDPVKPRLD